MHLYYTILQKVSGCKTLNYPSMKNDFESSKKFWENAKIEQGDMVSYIYFLMQNLSRGINLEEFISLKMRKIHDMVSNSFLMEKNKRLLEIMYVTQRHYNAFATLVKIIRYKKSSQINTDLLMNPFSEKERTVKVLHQSMMYEFTVKDLINIIKSSLSNCDSFYAEPKRIKNPYNNLPFSLASLYNIYFAIKRSDYIMPVLFHQYFICNFDMDHFGKENEYLIRDANIKNLIYNTNEEDMFKNMKKMMKSYLRNISIDDNVDKSEFIRIVRPYYYLFLTAHYNVKGIEKTNLSFFTLRHKLKELYEYNCAFGRTMLKREPITRRFKRMSNLDHPVFTMNEAYKYKLYDILNGDETDDSEDDSED